MAPKKRVNLTLSEESWKALTKIAKRNGLSRSAMLEYLVRERERKENFKEECKG
jgi:macrodomain Ter protein organizer (MatP/YcbG family)